MRQLMKTGLRACAIAGVVALVTGIVAAPAASAQQSVNFTIGGFVPRGGGCFGPGCSDRATDDVLANNLSPFAFNIRDFKGASVGGEYLVGLGNSFEAGLGVGFYSQTVPSFYRGFVNADGTEIQQDLKLRVIPFSATVRWLMMGRNNGIGIQPYIGGGVGVFAWRYSESGQFIASDHSIFQGTFVGSGSATGPVILGGLRVPIGPAAAGFEIRYQRAEGNLPVSQDFAGGTIDLGGITYNFTIGFRF